MILSSKAFIGGRGRGLGSPEGWAAGGIWVGGGRELRRIGSRRDMGGGVREPRRIGSRRDMSGGGG